MVKLTAAAVERYRAGKVRREIPDAGSPGMYLVVQVSGKKSWAMRFRRPNGKPAKLTLGPVDLSNRQAATELVPGAPLTLADARALAAEIHRRRKSQRDVVADHEAEKRRVRTEARERTANAFGQAARDFVANYKVKKTGKRPRRWRETARVLGLDYSADGGEPTEIRGGLAQRWRDKPIVEISKDDVGVVIDESRDVGIPGLSSRNGGPSDARGRKMADALGAMFGKWIMKDRQRRKMVSANPCLDVVRPDAPPKRDRVLNVKLDVRRADELRWFWATCGMVGEPFGALCKLLLLTGCRLNEIARMTRDELSDDMAMLRLSGERTKNNLPHDVPLPPLARDILTSVRRIDSCKYVFSTTGKTPVSGFSKLKDHIDAMMLTEAKKERGKDATIPPWRLHDLRRTAATGMASIGIAPHIIEAVLNHVSGAKGGVAGIYNTEKYGPERKTALERWAAYVQGVVSGRPAKVLDMHKRGRDVTRRRHPGHVLINRDR